MNTRLAFLPWRLHLAGLVLVLLGLTACNGEEVTGPNLPENTGMQTKYVLGYSNTRGTADAANRTIDPEAFVPFEVVRSADKVLIEESTDFDAYLSSRLQPQLDWVAANNVTMDGVWWQVGIREQMSNTPSARQLEIAHAIAQAIHRKLPNLTLYVSSMSPYSGHVCNGSGPGGPAASDVIADELEATYSYIKRVPTMPALTRTETIDGCHQTDPLYERDAALLMDNLQALAAQ
jgi:hypothetical protein